jgi:hypothetical protein
MIVDASKFNKEQLDRGVASYRVEELLQKV